MTIQLRGKKVAVEKIKKAAKNESSFLSIPEAEEYFGIIKYTGAEVRDLKEGLKVYFGRNFQTFKIAGTDLCLMEEDQVLAVVVD